MAKLQQQNLFQQGPARRLEKIPFELRYQFVCDDPRCQGHSLRIWDWEVAESYRNWRSRYRTPDELQDAMVKKYLDEMREKRDTHFFMGTMAAHPQTWTIIGLFYPMKESTHR